MNTSEKLAEYGLTPETYEECLKLCRDKINSVNDIDWSEIVDKYDLGIHPDTLRKASSGIFGSAFVKEYFDEKHEQENATPNYLSELDSTKRELERAKIQFRDERKAWNKQNYLAARVEQDLDYLGEVLSKNGSAKFEIPDIIETRPGYKQMIVTLADLHIGSEYDSYTGEYNAKIAQNRLEKYLAEAISIGKENGVNTVHISALGDMISGIIHKTVRLGNRENLIDQIKVASDYITNFCYEMTKNFSDVYFYSVGGNHSRITEDKDDSLKDERLDDLIGWSVCRSLSYIPNFHDMTMTNIDSTIGHIDIGNKIYVLLHGDYDSMTESGISRLSTFLEFFPDYTISGHKHTPAMYSCGKTTSYQVGSLCGSGDDYTIGKRLSGGASQSIFICDSEGDVRCCYNVKLN